MLNIYNIYVKYIYNIYLTYIYIYTTLMWLPQQNFDENKRGDWRRQ